MSRVNRNASVIIERNGMMVVRLVCRRIVEVRM